MKTLSLESRTFHNERDRSEQLTVCRYRDWEPSGLTAAYLHLDHHGATVAVSMTQDDIAKLQQFLNQVLSLPSTVGTKFRNGERPDEVFSVRPTNWGEPYADGVRFQLLSDRTDLSVSLTNYDVRRLRDYLGHLVAAPA